MFINKKVLPLSMNKIAKTINHTYRNHAIKQTTAGQFIGWIGRGFYRFNSLAAFENEVDEYFIRWQGN